MHVIVIYEYQCVLGKINIKFLNVEATILCPCFVYEKGVLFFCHSLIAGDPLLPLAFFLKVTLRKKLFDSSVPSARLICLRPCFPAGPK